MNAIVKIETQVSGHFELIVSGGARGRVVLATFDNMILDAGLNQACGAAGTASLVTNCQIGTGNTAPSAAQTALVARVASTANIIEVPSANAAYVAGSPAYVNGSWKYRFALGAVVGTMAEIGVGWASAGSLWARALITTSGGTPTTITVLADEQLDVVYTLRVYSAGVDGSGSVVLGGITYNYVSRRANFSASPSNPILYLPASLCGYNDSNGQWAQMTMYTGVIGLETAAPAGTSAVSYPNGTATPAAYSNNSYQRAVTYTCGLSGGNVAGGAKSILVTRCPAAGLSNGSFQFEFTPNIPKTASNTLSLTFMYSLARRP